MDPFDPSGSGTILAAVLTAAGVPIAGAIIAAVIQAAKSVPGVGALVTAQPVAASMVVSAGLIVYAAVATHVTFDMVSVFGLALAWLALNGFSKATYDTAVAVKSSGS